MTSAAFWLRKHMKAALFAVLALCLVIMYHYSMTHVHESNEKAKQTVERKAMAETVPVLAQRPLPTGVCKTYSELRDINFLHQSIRDHLCKGAPAYSIVDSAFPLCELPPKLPDLITNQVRSMSHRGYLRSPLTHRNISCFTFSNSDYISDQIRNSHIFEHDNVKQVMKTIQRFNSRAPLTFVDIGSNVGTFTLPALDLGVPVVALDANIRNLMRVKLSAESAGFSRRLRLLWNFISSQVSLMYLNFPQDCNVGGATKFGRAVVDTVPVMSTTGDAIIGTIATKTAILKVDIEGGEAAFFGSAARLFNTFDIPVVFMEWLEWHMSDEDRKLMIQFFQSRRYSARNFQDFSKKVNIEDPKLSTDVAWVREDVIKVDG